LLVLGAVNKRRLQLGVRRFVQCGQDKTCLFHRLVIKYNKPCNSFADGEGGGDGERILHVQTSALLVQKTLIFWEFMTILYGHLLWTSPYKITLFFAVSCVAIMSY